MPDSCFAERLCELIVLTSAERAALAQLESRERVLRRGATLVRENDRQGELFVLRRGTMMSYVLLDDGSRQILRFHFPGDLLAVSALVYGDSPESLAALTDCAVSPFDRAALATVCEAHPRLACAIMVYNQIERVTLTDRLAAIGRTSAKGRVSAVLLEMRNRMRRLDTAGGGMASDSFTLGLTQEEIGDATGLTAVHVNRMLRQLEDEGLIARDNGRVRFLNEVALMRAANFVDRQDGLDLGWLPASR